MSRAVYARAGATMALLGDKYSAQDAKRMGLMGYRGQSDGDCIELATRLSAISPEAIYQTRKAFDSSFSNSYASQLAQERNMQHKCFDHPGSICGSEERRIRCKRQKK